MTPVASDADYISTTETLTTPWALQLDGVLTFSQAQHVTITCTSDETLATFTIVGTDRYGFAQTEDLTGPNNGVVVSVKNYASVASVTSTADATGVTAGVDGTCESQWIPLDYRVGDFAVGLAIELVGSGAMTMGVEHTFENVLEVGFLEGDAVVHVHDSLTGKTANTDGNYASPPNACRFAIEAHTSGSGKLHVIQSSAR